MLRIRYEAMSSVKSESGAQKAFDSREAIASLPNRPGVYRMLDSEGETLYVGKARDLKKRVASYFQKTDHHPRTAMMVTQVARIETTVSRCCWKTISSRRTSRATTFFSATTRAIPTYV